jgi:RHS repeat-associated protein
MLIDTSDGTKTYYFQLDDLNTVHALLDHNGTAVERYDYSAYGETHILDANGQTLMVDDDADEEFDVNQDGIIDIGYPRAGEPVTPRVVASQSLFDNPFGYAGMRRDEHTGLYHTHYREYNPNMGRWLTPDPAGYQDGQNLYCYYPNVNGVDVLGLAAYDPWYVNWIEEPFIGATAFAGEAIGTVKNAIVKDYRKWSGLSDNIKASSALSNEELVGMSRQVPNSTQAAKEIVDVVRPHLEDVPKGINAIATGIVNRDAHTVLAGGALLGGVALDVVDFVPDPSDAAQMAARKTALETISKNRFETRPHEAVFWSGIPDGAITATNWVARNGGTTLETTLAKRCIELPQWNGKDPAVTAAWRKASREFAEGASGHIKVLQPNNAMRYSPKKGEGSVWAEVEWLALIKNPKVESITSINPDTGTGIILWKR